jgi:hypothetical protein
MNWDAIGAIGQTVGAFAVVVTLGYLAVQVRVSRSTATDANRLTRAVGAREAVLSIVNNDDLIDTIVTAYGMKEYYDELGRKFALSTKEAARVDFLSVHWFWVHWGQFSSTKDQDDLSELSRHIAAFYAIPFVGYSWRNSPLGRTLLDPRFVEFVDGLLSAKPS